MKNNIPQLKENGFAVGRSPLFPSLDTTPLEVLQNKVAFKIKYVQPVSPSYAEELVDELNMEVIQNGNTRRTHN